MLQITAKFLAFIFIFWNTVFAAESNDSTLVKKIDESIFSALDKESAEEIERQGVMGSFYNTAQINIVDKKMGKMDVVTVNLQKPIMFNDEIAIRVLSCWKENEKKLLPDSKAWIEFYTVSKQNELDKQFSGWIFSNNAGISKYFNEKYEFILSDCIDN
ncbi:hypothetical protein I862_04720 [endosymbiont of Acanthamoeba sp. UWC8]|uniref:DUF2155 domain-containing protein n=1 Tax=endosymbiont of Acanthamoeba sp. UWC8 TaxID=86106 RepID=UPI0004D194D4|nr:DUF2155 domain-containing protein [endosymbiont of Acanthamoeba sp. UWC8]AIF81502.1 hypothetical protein I862_04720 [endosymbiont of Acanthamoeba sp. UWC8]